jgi:hypothetical protein
MVVYSLQLNYDTEWLRFKRIPLELHEKQIIFIMGTNDGLTVRKCSGYGAFASWHARLSMRIT